MATTAVLVAPWVEEAAKGAAVLGVFLFRRKEFDGIVDGIVLAGFTGLGFAFTENILYFGRAFLAGNEELGVTGGLFAAGTTFVLRGVLAPFAHPLVHHDDRHRLGHRGAGAGRGCARWLAPIGGYLAAVALHAMWNYSSLSGLGGFLVGYVLHHGAGVPGHLGRRDLVAPSRGRDHRQMAAALCAGWLAGGRGRGHARVDATASPGCGVGRTDIRRRQLTGPDTTSSWPGRSSPSCANGPNGVITSASSQRENGSCSPSSAGVARQCAAPRRPDQERSVSSRR